MAVRISKSGKNGSIRVEPKPGELSGADTDIFMVLVEDASKNRKFTRAELTLPQPPMTDQEGLPDASAKPSTANEVNEMETGAATSDMSEAEEAQETRQQNMEENAAVEAEILSSQAATAHASQSDGPPQEASLASPQNDMDKHKTASRQRQWTAKLMLQF